MFGGALRNCTTRCHQPTFLVFPAVTQVGFSSPSSLPTSAASTLDFGVEAFEFMAGVVDFELPVDAALLGVGFLGPGADLRLQEVQLADAASRQALAREATEFALGDIEPTAVFGRV